MRNRKGIIMKKQLLIITAVAAFSVALAGCGEAKDNGDAATAGTPTPTEAASGASAADEQIIPPSLDDMDLSKIVTLAEYKGMELDKILNPVTDEVVETEIKSALLNMPEPDEDGVVDDGDTANIDYEGKVDGVAFEGGTGQGHNLQIGSGAFIPGFEEALIGAKKGETLDIDITFPENYAEELKGKDAVFTVTINEVSKALEEATDEWVEANSEYKTVAEYKESIRERLEDYNLQSAEAGLSSQAWNKLVEESEVTEYPEEVLEYGRKLYEQNVKTYAEYSGQTLEEYLESQGVDMDAYNEEGKKAAEEVAKQMLVMNAVVQVEEIKEGDEAYEEMIKTIEEESGMSIEELTEQYGAENIKQNILIRIVQQLIVDHANITEVVPTPLPTAEPADEELPEGHSADDGHDH